MGFSLELFFQQLENLLSIKEQPEIVLAELKKEVTKAKEYAIQTGALQPEKHPTYLSEAWLKPFMIFDTETTGLGGKDEIIQLGLIDFDEMEVINDHIKPTIEIPPESIEIHGITQEYINETGGSWHQAWEKFCKYTEGNVLIAWNIDYDLRLLKQTCQAHGADFSLFKPEATLCAMKAYAQYANISKGRISLANACEKEKVNTDNAHDAIADCIMTYRVISSVWDKELTNE